jgi:hypothetical protein
MNAPTVFRRKAHRISGSATISTIVVRSVVNDPAIEKDFSVTFEQKLKRIGSKIFEKIKLISLLLTKSTDRLFEVFELFAFLGKLENTVEVVLILADDLLARKKFLNVIH